MGDDSGRLAWLWGPLVLVGVLVAVFQLAGTTGDAPRAGPGAETAHADAPSSRLAPDSRVAPDGAAASRGPDGGLGSSAPGFHPGPGYPPALGAAGPTPCWAPSSCSPGAGFWWPQPFPRPGDHSDRYWGMGAAEWGPPIGEYGPDAQVDPYWWVPPLKAER